MIKGKKLYQALLALCLGFMICNVNSTPTFADGQTTASSIQEEFIYQFKAPKTALDYTFSIQPPTSRDAYFADSYSFGYQIQTNQVAFAIYDALRSNIETLKTGTGSIPFSFSVANFSQSQFGKDLQTGYDAFDRDYSEVFWINIEKLRVSYLVSGNSVQGEIILNPAYDNYFSDDYSSQAEVEQDIANVEQVIQQLAATATGTDYDKLKYFHDYIVDKVEYNRKLFTNQASPKAWEITSGLYYGSTDIDNIDNPVCEGYARALKVLCDQVGIPNMLISGLGNGEDHMWNYVRLDGKWYAIDATFDDPIFNSTPPEATKKEAQYKYFMKGSSDFDLHINDGSVVPGGYVFTYPTLNLQNYDPATIVITVPDGTIYQGTTKLGTGFEIFQLEGLTGLNKIMNNPSQYLYVVQNKLYPLADVNAIFKQYETLSKAEVLIKIPNKLASMAKNIITN